MSTLAGSHSNGRDKPLIVVLSSGCAYQPHGAMAATSKDWTVHTLGGGCHGNKVLPNLPYSNWAGQALTKGSVVYTQRASN